MKEPKPIVIIGVGNFLMGDEGAGVHAIKRLEQESWPDTVELIDGGTPGMNLMYMIENRRLAVLIDCADFGAEPGAIDVFDPDDLKRDERSEISLHATDLLSALELARRLGHYPEAVRIVGIQPKAIAMTTTLSDTLTAALEKLPETITKLITL